jgi:hypothetical protein
MSGRNVEIFPLENIPPSSYTSTTAVENVYKDAGDVTLYASTTGASGTVTNLDLGTTADTNLQNGLGANRFGIGLKISDESRDGSVHTITISSSTAATLTVAWSS